MSAVNPIPVVRNNLPDYRTALLKEHAKVAGRLAEIDREVAVLDKLAAVLGIEGEAPIDPEYNET